MSQNDAEGDDLAPPRARRRGFAERIGAAIAPLAGMIAWFIVAAATGVVGFFISTGEPPAPQGKPIVGVVTRVIDGADLYISSADARVRLWGIDASEVTAAGGASATLALYDVADGVRVSCERMDTDRDGRIIGRCMLPNGDDVAARLIRSGFAREHRRLSHGYYSLRGIRREVAEN